MSKITVVSGEGQKEPSPLSLCPPLDLLYNHNNLSDGIWKGVITLDLYIYEEQVREYIKARCREHVKLQEKLLGRPITFDYRYEHTRTAVGIADSLAGQLGVDPALARITTWLHDIAKCWDPRLDEEINRARSKNHGPRGGEEATDHLGSIGFPDKLSRQVKQAISVHAGFIKDYTLDRPLDALLWDADKLSKIGPAGVMHYLCGNLAMGSKQLDLEQFFSNLETDWRRGIRDSLNTEVSLQMADKELTATASLQTQMLSALKGKWART